MARKKKDDKESAAARISKRYTTNLASLNVFVENVAPIVIRHDKNTVRKIDGITKKIMKITSKSEKSQDEEGKEIVRLSEEQFNELNKTIRKFPRIPASQAELLYKSSFVMLVSYFDFLVSDLIHCYYQMYPKSLGG